MTKTYQKGLNKLYNENNSVFNHNGCFVCYRPADTDTVRMDEIKDCSEDLPEFVDMEGFTGVAYGNTHDFVEKESFTAKLEVIKCKKCGKESISWERMYDPT